MQSLGIATFRLSMSLPLKLGNMRLVTAAKSNTEYTTPKTICRQTAEKNRPRDLATKHATPQIQENQLSHRLPRISVCKGNKFDSRHEGFRIVSDLMWVFSIYPIYYTFIASVWTCRCIAVSRQNPRQSSTVYRRDHGIKLLRCQPCARCSYQIRHNHIQPTCYCLKIVVFKYIQYKSYILSLVRCDQCSTKPSTPTVDRCSDGCD